MTQKLKEISIKEKIDIDDNALLEIAKYSNGGLRDAIGLLEKAAAYTDKTITSNIIKEISGNVSEEDLNNFITLFQNKDIEQLIIKINDFYNEGIDLLKLANNIIEYLRDEIIVNKHYDRSLCKLINELDQMVTLMEKSENSKIIFEVTIINCLLDEEPKVEQAKEIKTVEEKKTEPKKEIEEPSEPKKIDDNIIDIRVGNTLYNPQKAIISEIRKNWDQIKDLAFDEQYGNVARLLSSDTMPVAASDTNIILVSKLKGIATQINGDVETVNEIINKTFNGEYMVVCLSEDDWKKYTAEYKDNKDKFKYQEEPKIEKTNKSLKDRAKELFD
jgi:DNA polymerase-3 subunit gamma/tau